MKKSKSTTIYFIGYTLLNVFLMFQLLRIGTLPTLYNTIIIGVLLLFMFIVYMGVFKTKKNAGKNASKVLMIILALMLVVVNGYLYKYGSFLGKITGGGNKNDTVSVIVKESSAYKTLADVKDLTFGLEDEKEALIDEGIEDFEKTIGSKIQTVEYKDYVSLANALMDDNVEVIIINEAFRNFITDELETFTEDTRIIAEFNKKTEITKTDVSPDKEVFSVMISGIDVYGSINSNSRSDVNILAVVNPVSKKIILVSIPRDYYLPLACKNNNMDKLTHTGIYGIDCTMDTVGALFGEDIDFFARVNFSSLINVINAVGGVNVNNERAFSAGGYDFPVGSIYLDGPKALTFVRDRYHQADGDSGRGRNQMKVITALINKIASPALITNFSSILNSLEGSFQTNMSQNNISSLVKMQINDMSGWEIKEMQVSGTGARDYSYALGGNYYMMHPDYNSVNVVKAAIKELSK